MPPLSFASLPTAYRFQQILQICFTAFCLKCFLLTRIFHHKLRRKGVWECWLSFILRAEDFHHFVVNMMSHDIITVNFNFYFSFMSFHFWWFVMMRNYWFFSCEIFLRKWKVFLVECFDIGERFNKTKILTRRKKKWDLKEDWQKRSVKVWEEF